MIYIDSFIFHVQVRRIQVHRTVARHPIQAQAVHHAMDIKYGHVINLSPNGKNLRQRNVSTQLLLYQRIRIIEQN